jgi:hypothetical protein
MNSKIQKQACQWWMICLVQFLAGLTMKTHNNWVCYSGMTLVFLFSVLVVVLVLHGYTAE